MGKTGRPTPLYDAIEVAERLTAMFMEDDRISDVLTAGSVRRQVETVSDLDLLIVTDGDREFTEFQSRFPEIHWTPKGGTADIDNVWVELYRCPPACEGAALQFLTGPGDLNVYLRRKAQRKGWKLSQYGLVGQEGVRIDQPVGDPWADEETIFTALGVPYLSPVERTHWRELMKGTG